MVEELAQHPHFLQDVRLEQLFLAPMGTTDAIEFLNDKLKQTKTNGDFFDSMNT